MVVRMVVVYGGSGEWYLKIVGEVCVRTTTAPMIVLPSHLLSICRIFLLHIHYWQNLVPTLGMFKNVLSTFRCHKAVRH